MNFRSILLALALISTLVKSFSQDHVPGQIMVQLTPGTTIESYLSEANNYFNLELKLDQTLSNHAKIYLISFDEIKTSEELVYSKLKDFKNTNACQFNHTNLKRRTIVPNDPGFSNQWAHINDGSGGVVDADMDSDEAWEITTGGNTYYGDTIVVAVIDEGIQLDHPDLQLYVNQHEIPGDNIDNDNNGYVDDVHGYDFWDDDGTPDISGSWESHGTHVAGIIGAKGDNCFGGAGVNWNVKIMAIRGTSSQESEVILAYDYVYQERLRYNRTNGDSGAYIVSTNSSFGVDYADANDYPIWCSFYDSLGSAGIISAVAGPNLNINIDNEGDVPGTCPSNYTICVTNTNKSDDRAFAGYGPINVDIGAPGSGIYSTIPNSSNGNKTGTSMATPQIAGAIALMYSALCKDVFDTYAGNPEGLASNIRNTLLTQGFDYVSNLDGEIATEGRLNLYKAVTAKSLHMNFATTDPDCEASNGSIDIAITGNNTPYSYSWSNGASTSSVSGLNNGIYQVSTSASNGCTATRSITLSDAPSVDFALSLPKCTGIDNGSINTSIIKGSSSLTYTWSNSNTTSSLTGLSAGTYALTITDGNCSSLYSIDLSDSASLGITANITDPNCGLAEGSIHTTVTNNPVNYYDNCGNLLTTTNAGTNYSYVWNNGATTDSIRNLNTNAYSLTITSDIGCYVVKNFVVQNIDGPEYTISLSEPSCNESTDGSIALVNVQSGTSPYSFNWENGNTTNSISSLNKGIYAVSVYDADLCLTVDDITLTAPNPIDPNPVINNVSCKGNSDGQIELQLLGGTSPYSFTWNNNQTTSPLTDLSPGTYLLTVVDNNNCTFSNSFTITEPLNSLSAASTVTNEHYAGKEDGAITISTTGGTPPYLFTWSNGSSAASINNLSAGVYYLTITDQNGCNYSIIDTVGINTGIKTTNFENKFNIYPNPSDNGEFKLITATSIQQPIDIYIYNQLGAMVSRSILTSQETKLNLNELPSGMYLIIINSESNLVHKELLIKL